MRSEGLAEGLVVLTEGPSRSNPQTNPRLEIIDLRRGGIGQAVIYNSATGVKYGASDPRKDGAAVPEPHPYYKN